MRDVVDAFRTRLAAAIDRLESQAGGARRDLWRAALEVEHLVLSDALDPEEEREVLRGLAAEGRTAVCRSVFAPLETLIECDFAALVAEGAHAGNGNLLADRDGLVANYLVRYEELARREAALARMSASDRVLFIGSGPFPVSAIEYCRRTGCRVDCLDFVEEAIRISTHAVHRLGLDHRMRCLLGRGEEFPVGEYSVVMVGVLAQPKAAILANIAATGRPGLRLLMRTTFGLRELIYPALDPAFTEPGVIRDVEISEARGDQVLSTVGGVAAI